MTVTETLRQWAISSNGQTVDCEQWGRLADKKGKDAEWCIGWILQNYPQPPRWLF